MRRIVITGVGVVSPLGHDLDSVAARLRRGESGLRPADDYREMGLRSQVCGRIELDPAEHIERKALRMMGDAAAYAYLAMAQAVADAGLDENTLRSERTGLIVGSGGGSNRDIIESADLLRSRGVRKIGPYRVPRAMSSTTSAVLSTYFGLRGPSYSISSACATSAHCIGAAAEQIQLGKAEVMFAGGGEAEDWTLAMLFDAMGALSTAYNDRPTAASRPFDADRDGFVMAGGGGIVVLEDFEHARARGAKIWAELVGYGATSDGYDMVAPSGEGAVRCMRQALAGLDTPVDYINAHGTGTPVGDVRELGAIVEVFGENVPPISSTKSLTGHALGAAGVHEVIYCLLMMRDGFIAPSANIDRLDPQAEGLPIVRAPRENVRLDTVLSNSFGFGGANASLVLRRLP
ncbi:MAG: beta-ketoacyl-[acyl-carrier-protein] synthase I [Gammaproteobacteria bacterium]|nr:MAG: beta-ketoacyl-[acyl-carrier-protein] synthase I [Gammaproteobacteria bacterium]